MLYAGGNERDQKGKFGKKSDKEIECFNCQKKGHRKADCWSKRGGKKGQGPRSKLKRDEAKKETTTVAEEEGVWMTMTDTLDDEAMEYDDNEYDDFSISGDEEFFYNEDEDEENVTDLK